LRIRKYRKTMSELTQTHGQYQNVARDGDEKYWDVDADRWTKGGNDRLYFNGCKFVEYVDLDTFTIVSDHADVDPWDATAVVDGEELTVKITAEGPRTHKEMSATFALPDQLAEEDAGSDDTEIIADGGEDTTSDLNDKEIEASIESKDDPDHPDVATIEEVRDVIAEINIDVLEWWGDHQDAIDEGAHDIVYEDSDVVVLADNSGHFWRDQFDAVGIENSPMRSIISSLHHKWARKYCGHSWTTVSPIVVKKPPMFRTGESHTLRQIARRTDELGSVARAVDTLAVEEHGWTQSMWAKTTGRNESTVSRTTNN